MFRFGGAWHGSLGMVSSVLVWSAMVWQASCVMVGWGWAWYGSLGMDGMFRFGGAWHGRQVVLWYVGSR